MLSDYYSVRTICHGLCIPNAQYASGFLRSGDRAAKVVSQVGRFRDEFMGCGDCLLNIGIVLGTDADVVTVEDRCRQDILLLWPHNADIDYAARGHQAPPMEVLF